MTDGDKLTKLLESVARIEVNIESIQKDQHDAEARTKALEDWRQGNGVVGVDKKLDRLEQTDKRKSKHFFVFYSAIVGGGIALGFAALKLFLFGGL